MNREIKFRAWDSTFGEMFWIENIFNMSEGFSELENLIDDLAQLALNIKR